MKKSSAFFAILALAVLPFVLEASGGPGEVNPGSTQQTVTSQFYGLGVCDVGAFASDYDPESNPYNAEAHAYALASAMAYVQAIVIADTELTVTRHGKHGAAHLIELDATLANATIHLSTSNAYAQASVEAQGQEFASLYFSVYANAYSYYANAYSRVYGSSWNIADADADAGAGAHAYAYAESYSASVQDAGVFVRGANIDEFEAGLTMNAYSFVSTKASSYVDVIADAFARASANAYASAYAHAYSSPYNYDFDRDYDSYYFSGWSEAFAYAAADSLAATLVNATYSANGTARFENLPGINDVLEIVTVNSSSISCSAFAGVWAYANAITY
jgi:hypothetical protein